MGWRVPAVVTATFVLLLCVSTLGLDPVTVTPNGGDFNFSVTINLSHTENVTDILYFIDDTPGVSKNLTSDNYTNYTSTFNLTNTGNYTLYTFVALNSTSNATSNVSFNIFDVSPMPNFYPPGNTSFVSSVTVTLQPATGSNKIYYTTEGFINTPAIGNISAIPAVYHEYTAPITLTAPLGGELRAPLFAYTVGDLASFQLNGSIRREFYDLLDRLPTPTFSPMGAKELGKITTPFPGPKASAQNSVEVQIDLPGMHNVSNNSYTTIVYTTDGRDPTRFSSVYSPWLDRANGTRRKINLVYAWFDSSNKTLNVNGTIQTLAEPVGWTYPYGQNTRTIKLKAMAFSQSEPNILSSGIQTAEYYFTRSPCSKTRCYAWDLKLTAGVCATLGHIDGIMCTSCEDAAQYWIKELLEVPVGEPTRLVDQFCRVGGGVVKLDFVEKEYCDHVKIAKGRCYGATCSAGWYFPAQSTQTFSTRAQGGARML